MTLRVAGAGVALRRAEPADAPFLAELAQNEEVAPYMAAISPRDVDAFADEIERGERAPGEGGRYVVDDEAGEAVGSIAFAVANRRSRIATLHGLMLHPEARGRGLARAATRLFTRHLLEDLGYHRVELECYGYNERAIRHFEASGFVREGVRRKAYWRNGDWVDGVLFGLVREELATAEPVERPR